MSLFSNYVLKYIFYTESILNSQVCNGKKMDRGRVDDSFPLVTGREETPQVAHTAFDNSEFSLTERLKESQKVYMIFRWGGEGGGSTDNTESHCVAPQDSLEHTTQNRLTLNS